MTMMPRVRDSQHLLLDRSPLLFSPLLSPLCALDPLQLNITDCPSISGDKDDSDSDFADVEESGGRRIATSYPSHGAGAGAGAGTSLGPNGVSDTGSYMDNPMHSRSEDLGDKTPGDNDSLSLTGRGKKERRRQDLPPLGKVSVPVAPQTPLGGVGSCVGAGSGAGLGPLHPTTLAPLVINGTGSGSVPSNSNSPTGRDFGSHLGITTSPMSNPGPVVHGRDGVLLDDWARKENPALLGTEETPVRWRDEGIPLKSLHPHLEDIRNIAHKFSTQSALSLDKLDRDRESVSKNLKDLLFSEGPDKRHIVHSRRSTGNIVTGHSLLHLHSSSQREPLNTSISADNYEAMSVSALSLGHNTGDERQINTPNSSSNAPHTALSTAHLFKMDLADSGVSFDPGSMKIQGPSGSSKHTVKSIRIGR